MPLAQLNIATTLYPIDAPEMVDFVNNLASINAIAQVLFGAYKMTAVMPRTSRLLMIQI